MSLAASAGGQNLVRGWSGVGVFCIPAPVPGTVTGEIDLWPEC
jgi:hypothetical protein